MKPSTIIHQGYKNHTRQQIQTKNKQFKNEIRSRQRQQIFNNIRKQYQMLYTTMHKQQMQQQNIGCYQIQQYPLASKMLQKYHNIPHTQIYQYLTDITQHLLDHNIYLSVYQQQYEHDSQNNQDQQNLLVHDLFYLTFQHDGYFVFPRKFKFVRNCSAIVASYVSVVSTQIMPQQLAYWANYMNQQDKQLMYLAILPQINQQNNNNQQFNNNLHYQAWVNHPGLRNLLLTDLLYMESAGKAIREIIGYRHVHPDRLKNNKGESLYELMCTLFHNELQSMVKSDTTKSPYKLLTIHIQISCKIIQAKLTQNQQSQQLIMMLSKILTKRIQSQMQLITPLFCIWIIQALLNKNMRILTDVGYDVVIGIIHYDQNRFIGDGNGRISSQKFRNFENIVYGRQNCIDAESG